MVPPFIFSSKTNRNPRQCHVVTPFFISFFNFKAFFFFLKKKIVGVVGHKRVASQPNWQTTPKAKHSNCFASRFSLRVAEPPPWVTGVVRSPQGKTLQNPQIFLFPVLPLGWPKHPMSHEGGLAAPRSAWATDVVQKAQKLLVLFF